MPSLPYLEVRSHHQRPVLHILFVLRDNLLLLGGLCSYFRYRMFCVFFCDVG